ncbi:hypothetical protein C7B61_19360 [filamentous cyanobacterium CCP1]|nr:hypothetical protein C7B76_04245 [filamentous cyanobacterium CCP2]PSB58354.1 hypothetical protein C7B61_19360 [filamentous cyanobacterium CCP1]
MEFTTETKSSLLKQLSPLPYPVYFVNKNADKFGDLMNGSPLPSDLKPYYEKCIDGTDIWTVQTYLHLRQRGLNVHLVPDCIPNQICVVAYHHLFIRDMAFNSYVVACRLDSARPEICEQQTVLNPTNVMSETDHFMPHWPQPILKPRDRSRGAKVETLDFKGNTLNLAEPFRTDAFHQQLNDLGIRLVLDSANAADKSLSQYQSWGDYTQSDVVLAVRNLTEYDFTLKPAIKLINAWHAGCPALLGVEPAYQAVRRSELDYIEVRTPDEAIAALSRLKNEPDLYNAMVENGFKRAEEFSTDRIAEQWRDLLANPIAKGYERWLKQNFLQKLIIRPIQFAQRTSRHKQQIQHYFYHREHGVRPYGENKA